MNQKNMIFLFIIIIKFIIGILIENSKGYNLNVLEEAGSCRVYNHGNSNNNSNNNNSNNSITEKNQQHNNNNNNNNNNNYCP